MEEGAHGEKNARCRDTRNKTERRPKTRWKDTCRRNMTIVGPSADTDRAVLTQTTTSHSDDPTCREKSEKLKSWCSIQCVIAPYVRVAAILAVPVSEL